MGILSIIGTIVVGFVVGLIARAVVPGVDALGFWLTAGLGIAGSIVGGVVAGLIWKSPDGRFHPGRLDTVDHRSRGPVVGVQPVRALTGFELPRTRPAPRGSHASSIADPVVR